MTADEAARRLGVLCEGLMARGKQLRTLTIANGTATPSLPSPLPADNLYQTDWAFRELQEALAKNRREEEETGS
jgi:hypothetical protein